MHGHLARKFVGRWNISFVLRCDRRLSIIFPSPRQRCSHHENLSDLFLSPLPLSATRFPTTKSHEKNFGNSVYLRVFLLERLAFQLTLVTTLKYNVFIFAINAARVDPFFSLFFFLMSLTNSFQLSEFRFGDADVIIILFYALLWLSYIRNIWIIFIKYVE